MRNCYPSSTMVAATYDAFVIAWRIDALKARKEGLEAELADKNIVIRRLEAMLARSSREEP